MNLTRAKNHAKFGTKKSSNEISFNKKVKLELEYLDACGFITESNISNGEEGYKIFTSHQWNVLGYYQYVDYCKANGFKIIIGQNISYPYVMQKYLNLNANKNKLKELWNDLVYSAYHSAVSKEELITYLNTNVKTFMEIKYE